MTSKLSKTVLASLALLVAPIAADAADMPIKAPFLKGTPRSVVAYYNWTGFYAGINVGYGFGESTWSLPPGTTMEPTGFLVGGTVGYNWQAGAIVYGVEADWAWSNVSGSVTCALVATCTTSSDWLATFRGRVGYAFDRWLPYATLGGAYGNVKATTSIPILGLSTASEQTQLGWTAGIGIEYAMMGNWTAKLEYLYVDLGSFNAAPSPLVNNVTFTENILRAGLNYKFAGPVFSRF
jgi:outer membrane immunogenic protein